MYIYLILRNDRFLFWKFIKNDSLLKIFKNWLSLAPFHLRATATAGRQIELIMHYPGQPLGKGPCPTPQADFFSDGRVEIRTL